MALKAARFGLNLLKCKKTHINQGERGSSGTSLTKNTRFKVLTSLGLIAGGIGALMYKMESSVDASANAVHPYHLPWNHRGFLSAIDHESVRRGYQVYKQICSACHSLQHIAYRNLVGVTHTEAEAKAEAEAVMVQDGPDDTGNYFERPGKLSDYMKGPYANEEAGRAANNGAYPPDLSYIVSGRKGGEDYIFALLTGYCDPPAGFPVREGQFFNPYFDGGAISMGQVLFDEAVEFSDGTPAYMSQLAKDVCTFLKWTSEPDHDDRKRLLIKVVCIMSFLIGISYYVKRLKWSPLKTRKIFFVPKDKE